MSEPLALLARPDKLSLGGGGMLIWAPPFPLWADRPGFWDHACFLEHRVEPLFTVTLLDLDAGLRPVPLALQSRHWTPADLTQDYTAEGLTLREHKALVDDVLVSELMLVNDADQPRRLIAVVWTCQRVGTADEGPWLDDPRVEAGHIRFTRRARGQGVVSDSHSAIAESGIF